MEYNNHDKAFKLFNKILDLNDKDEKTLYQLGQVKAQQGNLEEAHNFYNKILNINPKNISAHSSLAASTSYDEKNEDSIKHLREMNELINDKTLDLKKKIKLSYSLGKAFDDIKNTEKAFFYYNEANFLKNSAVPKYDLKKDKDGGDDEVEEMDSDTSSSPKKIKTTEEVEFEYQAKIDELNKKVIELSQEPSDSPVDTNKFSTDKKDLTPDFRKMTKRERILYNITK
jgi:tetratricopeptide (TPR) repeat protein